MKMERNVPENKVIFGSDYPWPDQRSHLTRVYLANISTSLKRKIFRENALAVYGLEDNYRAQAGDGPDTG